MLVGFSNMKGHLQKDFCRGRVTNICCERNFMILLRGEINIFHFLQRMIKNIQCLFHVCDLARARLTLIYLYVTLHTLIELFGEFKLFILLLLHDDNCPDFVSNYRVQS